MLARKICVALNWMSNSNPCWMIATGVIGFIFGLYYLIGKRRLAPLILAHGVINTIGMVANYVSDGAIT